MLDVAGAVVPMTLRARYLPKRLAPGICTRKIAEMVPCPSTPLPRTDISLSRSLCCSTNTASNHKRNIRHILKVPLVLVRRTLWNVLTAVDDMDLHLGVELQTR